MDLIIRDDDLSYWTNPSEIEEVYKLLFDKKIKISFATIPFSVNMFNAGDFSSFYQDENSSVPIDKNSEIVEYIKEKISDGLVEIMLHGYNHLYSFSYEGKIQTATQENLESFRKENKNIQFLGEYNYQDYETLNKKTKEGKEYLEDIFNIKIKNFVPPSNQIGKDGIRAIVNNNLNLSGLIGKTYDREFGAKGFYTYLKRVLFALRNKAITYPSPCSYDKHKELVGYAFTPTTNFKNYYEQFEYCKENGVPFQLATHYWELKDQLKDEFYKFIENSQNSNFKSKFLKEVI